MFKSECTAFLDVLTLKRKEAIEKSVKEELQKRHDPFVEELQKTKKNLIEEETAKTEAEIEKLRLKLQQKIDVWEEKANKAIMEDKAKVEIEARNKIREQYDSFILNVCRLVDETKIN